MKFFTKTLKLTIILFLCFGCSDNENNNSDQLNLNQHEVLSFNDMDYLTNLNLNVSKSHYDNSIEFNSDFKQVLGDLIEVNDKIASFYLYSRAGWNSGNLSLNNIDGISIIRISDDGVMYHDLYLRENNKFNLELSVMENKLNYHSIWFNLINRMGYSLGDTMKEVRILTDKNINYEDFNTQRNAFPLLISKEVYSKSKLRSDPSNNNIIEARVAGDTYIDDGGGDLCGLIPACMNMITGNCVISPSGGDRCESNDGGGGDDDPGVCSKNKARSASNLDQYSDLHSSVSVTYLDNNDLHYSFRDNFLNSSELGKKYIYYYNALSQFLISPDFYDYELLSSTISAMPKVDEALNKIFSGEATDIVIDSNIYLEVIELINIIESKSDNESFLFVLNDLRNDLNIIYGKTKAEILIEFN
jgi:hypothetical protein